MVSAGRARRGRGAAADVGRSEALADLLRDDKSLTTLWVSSDLRLFPSGVTELAAAHLAEALHENKTLTELK